MSSNIKAALDWVAGFITLAGVAQIFNALLMVPAAIYMCCRIYEWFEKRQVAAALVLLKQPPQNVPKNGDDE